MSKKVKVIDIKGESSNDVELPDVFSAPLRTDLVKRSFWIIASHGRQPYGRDPMAGEKTTAETSNPPTGRGISRIPRVKGDRHPRSGQAAGVASVVGGRLPHPPKAEKVIYQKINQKEKRLALASAIAFTADSQAVTSRGHRVANGATLPLVVSDEVETIAKTADFKSFLGKAGLDDELTRLYGGVKRLSGKSRMRGRAHREKVGPLLVVSNDRGVARAASSIPGVEVVSAESLSVLNLSPGGVPGRLTLWTESSLDLLSAAHKKKNNDNRTNDDKKKEEMEEEMKVAA
jgi:large subunit ribosomal protein L4e